MAAAPSHLESAKGRKEIEKATHYDQTPLTSNLSEEQEISDVSVNCRRIGTDASSTYGLLIRLGNGYAFVEDNLKGEERQAFIKANAGNFLLKHGVTIGPKSERNPTGFQIGNLSGRVEHDNRAILNAFREAGRRIDASRIKHMRPTAEETWMFVYNMRAAAELTPSHVFSIETRVKGGGILHGLKGAKEALLLMESLIVKKKAPKKIIIHVTDTFGETKVSYDKPLHDSYYQKVHTLEEAKEMGREVGIHGSHALDRLNLGTADIVLRTAKALTKYFGDDYDADQDKRHIEECEGALVYMKHFCRSREIFEERKGAAKQLFGEYPGPKKQKHEEGRAGGAAAPGQKPKAPRRRRKKKKEAFCHIIL